MWFTRAYAISNLYDFISSVEDKDILKNVFRAPSKNVIQVWNETEGE